MCQQYIVPNSKWSKTRVWLQHTTKYLSQHLVNKPIKSAKLDILQVLLAVLVTPSFMQWDQFVLAQRTVTHMDITYSRTIINSDNSLTIVNFINYQQHLQYTFKWYLCPCSKLSLHRLHLTFVVVFHFHQLCITFLVMVMVARKGVKNGAAPVSNSAYFKVILGIQVGQDLPPPPPKKKKKKKIIIIIMPNTHLLPLHHLPQLIQLIFHIRLTFCRMCLQICHLWIQTYSFRPKITSL